MGSAKPRDAGSISSANEGAVAGAHPSRDTAAPRVAPTLEGKPNTIQAAVFPIACFKVESLRFDFESSLVMPALRREMPALARLLTEHAEPSGLRRRPPISLFGHADPVGSDAYNKALSGRRAIAIYGLLTRRADVWEDLYQHTSSAGKIVPAASGDTWGIRALQIMLASIPLAPPNGSTPAPGSAPPTAGGSAPETLIADGQLGPKTRDRVRAFQASPHGQAHGLAVDGEPGPKTREALFLAYMDRICVDQHGKPFQVDRASGFLGRGSDPEGKADFQGCSELNPSLLFSESDRKRFEADSDKTERDRANAENRRVMVLLYRPGVTIPTDRWPCPRANEPIAGCTKRLWSDGDARRRNGPDERRFELTHDTFACRFYHRMMNDSPCERLLETVQIRLFDRAARPLAFAPCRVTEPGKPPRGDRTSGPIAGGAAMAPPAGTSNAEADDAPPQGGFVTVRDLALPATVHVEWSRPKPDDGPDTPPPADTDELEFAMDVRIELPDDDDESTSLLRLANLGYVEGPTQEADVRAFQSDHRPRFPDIEIDGVLDEATRDAIRQVHDRCDPTSKVGAPAGGASGAGGAP